MPNKKLILGLTLSLAGAAYGVTANFPSVSSKVHRDAPFVSADLTFPKTNEEEIINNLKMSSSKRKPANQLNIKTSQMQVLQKLVAELHSLKTSEQVQAYLEKLDASYESYPNDVKFYVASITPTMAFRGMFFRLRTMFENSARFQHSQVLTFAKALATRSHMFLPYDHADALYEYVSSPYLVGDSTVAAFKDEADVQIWQVKELLPQLTKSISRLESLKLIDPIIWDQRVVHGAKSFQDDIGRFKMIGEFEKNLAIASLYSSVSNLCVARAYNVENTIALSREVGTLYGFDGFGFNQVAGVSAQKITNVMNKKAFRNTGVLMVDGNMWMNKAYEASLRSIGRVKRAWNYSANLRDDEVFYVFNTGYLNVNREEIEQNLELIDRVVHSQGNEALRSAVTGEVIQVNYKNLFTNPPRDLKSFLPNNFEKGATVTRNVVMPGGKSKKLTYRNYSEGKPIGWNTDAFQPYFPSIKEGQDVDRTLRVLSHAGGNWLGLN